MREVSLTTLIFDIHLLTFSIDIPNEAIMPSSLPRSVFKPFWMHLIIADFRYIAWVFGITTKSAK